MKKLLTVLLTVLMALSLVGCAGGNEPEDEESYAEKAANRQKEILASIEPDLTVTGTLVVVSPSSNGTINAIRPGFTTKYPNVQLQIISLGTGDCLSRIQAEAENPTIDVMWGGLSWDKWYNNQGYWEEYISPNEANIKVDACKAENQGEGKGYFTSYGTSGNTAFIINTEVLAECGLKPEDITGYKSIIEHADKLKGGMILSGDPVKSSSAWQELICMLYIFGGGKDSNWNDLDMDAGWDYVEKFIAATEGVTMSSSSAIYKNVIAGEAAIGITYEDPCLQALKDECENIVMVYPEEGNNWSPGSAAIIKNAPHKELAKLWIDFLLAEGQELYGCTTMRGVTGVKNIVPNFKSLEEIPNVFDQDLKVIAEKTTEWKAKWTELLNAYNN